GVRAGAPRRTVGGLLRSPGRRAAERLTMKAPGADMRGAGMGVPALVPGERFPDLELPDHTGRPRRLSEVAGGDPMALFTSRRWWCSKEPLTQLQQGGLGPTQKSKRGVLAGAEARRD